MIHITAGEPGDSEWTDWCDSASKAAKAMVDAFTPGAKPSINNDLYKAQKQKLLEIFNNKCAFCETPIPPGMHGDVEHFRPKGAVMEEDGSPATYVDETGQVREHPGYYWLAYDWRNLLPSCQLCNQPSAGGGGKRNFFPLRTPAGGGKAFRATKPGEEEKEEPLFLHPWRQDPSKHFLFERTGLVIGLTDEGRKCVERLKLNREALQTQRQSVYFTARDKFNSYMGKSEKDEDFPRLQQELLDWKDGKAPYSAPAREAIRMEKELKQKRLNEL